MDLARVAWRKSTRSAAVSNCVELAYVGAVRDSKNSAGPVLQVDRTALLAMLKAGAFDL